MNTNNEVWKDIKGYEGIFIISSLGRVARLQRQFKKNGKTYNIKSGIKKPTLTKQTRDKKKVHYYVGLQGKLFSVHRLVAINFIDNPDNKDIVNHKDGNRLNNNIDNLEWVSQLENVAHYNI